MHPLIETIIAQKSDCFFISPHLDDAALSAGGLITYLARYNKVTVFTLFTHGSKPVSRFARNYMGICGYEDVEQYFRDRRAEDKKLFQAYSVETHHGGYVDASCRKYTSYNLVQKSLGRVLPEFLHVYPTGLHVRGPVSNDEKPLVSDIGKTLKQSISPKAIVFCPWAIKTHVDHLVTREACEQSFGSSLIYWMDYPYNPNLANTGDYKSFMWESSLEDKKKLVEGYKTQLKALFKNSQVKVKRELYLYSENLR